MGTAAPFALDLGARAVVDRSLELLELDLGWLMPMPLCDAATELVCTDVRPEVGLNTRSSL